MRTYKNYDVPETRLTLFLDVMSDLQCDIRGACIAKEGLWRFLLFVDASDEETLDRTIESFKMKEFSHANNE
jgi:hypothetical protein